MALDNWPDWPDAAQVVMVSKEFTRQGLPCQIRVLIEYTKGGTPLGVRPLTINPGWLNERGTEDPETTFVKLWDAIPGASQAVKDALRTKIPTAALKALWRA